VANVDGQMIDVPIYRSAQRVLRRAGNELLATSNQPFGIFGHEKSPYYAGLRRAGKNLKTINHLTTDCSDCTDGETQVIQIRQTG